MATLKVILEPSEYEALTNLAQRERRDPRAQAALIIRRALARRKPRTAAPPPAQAPDLPDWLAALAPPSAQAPDLPEEQPEEMPDWLRQVTARDGGQDDTK